MTALDVRELHTMEDLDTISRLYAEIWGTAADSPPVSAEVMRALSHAGNYVAGAYEQGHLVGASVGFYGDPVGTTLHSHITGASQGRGIGLALKLHQRRWALDRGLKRITWTYDPLIRRNAYFNLVKLGARPEEYLRSFYGAMDDAINGGDESDRVLTAWDLAAPAGRTPSTCPPTQPTASATTAAARGRPERRPHRPHRPPRRHRVPAPHRPGRRPRMAARRTPRPQRPARRGRPRHGLPRAPQLRRPPHHPVTNAPGATRT